MTKFRVLGQEELVDTAKEVQKLLGGKVTMKDILAGKVEGVEIVTEDGQLWVAETAKKAVTEDITPDPSLTGEIVTDPILDLPASVEDDGFMEEISDAQKAREAQELLDKAEEEAVAKALAESGTKVITTPTEDIEYPEVGGFKDEKAMAKFIRKITDAQVYEWAELEGITWKTNPHEAINRMRAVMALKARHFPVAGAGKSTKSKSKYADMTTEYLVALASEKGVVVKDAKGDAKIQRMYTIMALKTAGLLA